MLFRFSLLERAFLDLIFNNFSHWNGKGGGIDRARRHFVHDTWFGQIFLYGFSYRCLKGRTLKSLCDGTIDDCADIDNSLASGLNSIARPASPKSFTAASFTMTGILKICFHTVSFILADETNWVSQIHEPGVLPTWVYQQDHKTRLCSPLSGSVPSPLVVQPLTTGVHLADFRRELRHSTPRQFCSRCGLYVADQLPR